MRSNFGPFQHRKSRLDSSLDTCHGSTLIVKEGSFGMKHSSLPSYLNFCEQDQYIVISYVSRSVLGWRVAVRCNFRLKGSRKISLTNSNDPPKVCGIGCRGGRRRRYCCMKDYGRITVGYGRFGRLW